MSHPLHTAPKTAAFKMSGGIYTLTTLELHAADTDSVAVQLQEMTKKAPRFFSQTAVILSFTQLKSVDNINLQTYRHLLFEHGMILVAIRGGGQKLQKAATVNGIAWLPDSQASANSKSPNVIMMKQQEGLQYVDSGEHPGEHPINKTRIINQPVRSGQQIHSHGDLIITSSVSSGAELLAEGNIHVYGSLRGRALAGINGDYNARIFCRQFEAELISVGGRYKIPSSTTLKDTLWGACVQIYLDQKSLHIQKL